MINYIMYTYRPPTQATIDANLSITDENIYCPILLWSTKLQEICAPISVHFYGVSERVETVGRGLDAPRQ